MKKASICLAVVLVALFSISASAESILFTASAPSVQVTKIGDELGSNFDILDQQNFIASVLVDVNGPPVVINPTTIAFFTVGVNCNTCAQFSSTYTVPVTVNGVTENLIVPYTWAGGPADTITIGGASAYFDQGNGTAIIVKQLPFGPITNGDLNNPTMSFVGYEFAAVPEPASLTLMGSGIIGLAGFIRRKLAR